MYADSALLFAKELNYLKSICKAESLLTKIDSAIAVSDLVPAVKREEYRASAVKHYKQYIIFGDSLVKHENQKRNPEKQTVDNLPVVNAAQNKLNAKKLILFIFISLSLLSVFLYIKKRNKK